MEEIVIAVLAKIAEYTVRPVGRWLCYSCHYKSNKENLKNQETMLQDARKEVERKVKSASDNGDEIKDNVETWLKKVDDIIKKLGGGEEEAGSRNSNPSCLNLKQRHQMSREAKQMVGNIAELLENGNFVGGVSHRPAAQEIVTPRTMDYITLDSRISIMKRIMEALENAKINKIGVWGSAGVGKSTLTKEIFRKAKEESLFNEVALANVTDSPNISRIQGEIADMLDLKLDPNCTTEEVRAARLRARLENDKKKILVILDDICERLDLEKIGITPSERCKVLLTSRDLRVLSKMGINLENNFKLDTLGEEEAWNLFEKMAGDTVKDDRDLRNEAIKVAKACGGLPIALVTVSRSLKDEKSLGIWKDALVQLTRPTPDTEIWSPLYSCIQLSYKRLDGRQLKSLFLLCARQGYYISYQDLLRYGFGLCLFDGIATLEEARNRLESIVRDLQHACLLLQSPRSSKEFYMHDLVRHVAPIIASKDDHNMFVMRGDGGQKAWPDVDELERCEALSIHGGEHIHKYPNKIECPNLRYFHVQCKDQYYSDEDPLTNLQGMDKLEDIYFQGMEKLAVLSLTNIQLSSLLPLTNLQALCLDGCKLGDIHWIGELKTLVILSLARSDISNLPGEIRSLTRLRLLDLTNCFKLRVIPPNVLSSFVNLEELYMQNIKVQWEVEGPNNEGRNASLAELKKLSHLTTLEIKILDANNLPKDLFPEKLERYQICIGDTMYPYLIFSKAAFLRSLALKLNMSSFQLDFGIKMLLKRTEYLYLDESNSTKSVFYELDREDFQQLKHLHIQYGNIKHIPELRTPAVAFPILETFVLEHMISLEEIFQGNLPLTSFKNLKVLEVENCEKLRFIFSSSIARGLSLLEELKIRRCKNLGAIFVKEDQEDHGREEVFCRLQTLVLSDLPKLVSFLSPRETNSEGNDHDLQLPLLHHQLSFPSLKNLHLQHLPKIKHVWSNVNGCESLKSLEIQDCGVMEDIVAREDGTDPTMRLLFPSLTLLRLDRLPKLKWFFQGVRTLESSSSKELHEQGGTLFGIEEVGFPNLTNLYLLGLPKIKHVWSKDRQTILRFQNLQEIIAQKCASLKSLFPASVGTCLKQLKEIRINACGVLEEIVGAEEGEAVGRMLVFEFPQVTFLDLENLPRLECFYKGVYISKWPMMKTMSIKGCEKVEVFASRLVSEEIVEEGQSQMSIKQPLFLVDELSFPCMKNLYLQRLPKIKHVWSNVNRCESLKSLKIVDCGVMEEIVAREVGTDPTRLLFPSLTLLRLDGLPKLKWFFQEVRTLESSSSKELHEQGGTLFGIEKVAFPNLTKLHLRGLPKIKHVWSKDLQTILRFQNLQEISVEGCASLKSLFPASISTCLKQLKEIRINACGVLEEIVGAEEGEAVGRTLVFVFVFPQVTSLHLENLPRLECFYKGVHISKWPMLKMMRIERCEKVEVFASGLMSFEVVEERQYSQISIKQPLFWVDELSFSSLKKLVIDNMDKLEIIWQDQVAASSFSKNIQYIEIHSCEKLLHVFQSNLITTTALTQRLTLLRITSCSSLETIFRNMEGHNGKAPQVLIAPSSGMEESVAREDGTARHIEFPILTEMRLDRLPKLKWILERVHTHLECPSLEILELWECEQVIWASKFASSSSSQEKSQQNKLRTCIQLPLPNLSELELGICRVKLPSTSFKKLRVLKLANCEKLRFMFPSSIARGLSLLEELEIKRCNNMGAIVVKEEKDRIEDGDVVLFHHLQTLVLEDLPELVSFLSTRSSFMTDCGQIIAEGNRDLHMPLLHHQVEEQLKILEIKDCGVEEIVAGGGGGGEPVARTILEFPRVTNLRLRNLKSLKWFYKGVHVTKWPMLGMIEIEGCEKVEIFASGVVSFEETVKERSSEMSIKQPLFLVDELSFSSLKTLHIRNMDKLEIICQDQVAVSSFSKNIQDVAIVECEKLLHVFQSNFRTTTILTQRLTRLFIWDCRSLETIFRNMEGHNGKAPQVLRTPSSGTEESVAREDRTARHVEFPILTQMRLVRLPKLKWILEGVHTNLEFPSLERLGLWECKQVILASKFASSNSSQETSQQNQLQTCIQLQLPNLLELQVWIDGREEIFPYEVVDPVPRLRRLDLKRLPMLTHLWKEDSTQPCPLFHSLEFLHLSECGKLKNIVPSSVFLQNLTELDISDCDGLINLLTSSTAETLVQLQKMTVTKCERITEIVAVEDGKANVAITFNKLAYLKLEDLPNLTHFCSGPYSFGFPSLDKVFVTRCPEMKPFCDRVSSTPELEFEFALEE